jgi:hypothetical protein
MRYRTLLLPCFFRSVLFILLFLTQTGDCFSQYWLPLGPDQRKSVDFNNQTVFNLFNRNDSIYAAVRNQYNTCLMIKKFNGISWDTVGTPFLTGLNNLYTGPAYAIITLDKGYTPYVAYPDQSQAVLGGFKPTVKKLVNGQWQTVGQAGIGQHAATVFGLEIDSSGTPYLLFNTLYDQKPNVLKFDGSSWDTVAAPSFSPNTVSNAILKLDPQGIPYVAYLGGGNVLSVVRLVNNTWSPVGTLPALSAASSNSLSVNFKTDGFPIIAVKSSTSILVLDFDGSSWNALPSLPNGAQNTIYLTLDTSNLPYVMVGGYVRKFDGISWNIVGSSPGQPTSSGALEVFGNDIIIANQNKIKKYNGSYWSLVGRYGYSSGRIETNKIAISSSGLLYSAFKDYENGGKLTVEKYVNGTWTYIGLPGFTTDSANNLCFAAGNNDTMFVAYTAAGFNGKGHVLRYDGSSWLELGSGTNTVSAANITDLSLTTDTAGIPLLAFVDPSYFNACHVRKFENGTWTSVGGGVMNTPPAVGLTLRVGPDNTIYLLNTTYLARFTGSTWQTVGNYGGSADKPDLRIDRNGTPYIVYNRFIHYGGLVNYYATDFVVKFDGGNWINLGSGSGGINGLPYNNGSPQRDVFAFKLAIDTAGRLFLASSVTNQYSSTPTQIAIRTFNGTTWDSINTVNNGWWGFYFPQYDFQLEAGNDYLFFAYDDDNAYLLGLPLPLWPLGLPNVVTSSSNVSLYPNPTRHSLTIFSAGLNANLLTIKIIDNVGKVVKRETVFCTNGVIKTKVNIESLPAGSYLILINGEHEIRVGRFIKE